MKIQRYKHDSPVSYTLGAALTFELVKRRPELAVRVWVSSLTDDSEGNKALLERCRQENIPVEQNDKAFHILSPKGNCFVIGEFRKEPQRLEEGSHIVLVNPSDAGNLGTIIRTAAGFGLPNIAVIRPAADVYDPRTVRATMGAVFHVKVEYFDAIEEYCRRFPDNSRYAFMLTSSKPLTKIQPQKPYSLVFGNEATGLPEGYAGFCQGVVIRHSRAIDSLNLPMAAGIAMFEFTKAEWSETEEA